MEAVFYGGRRVALALLEAGADVTIQNVEGKTALHYAATVSLFYTRLMLLWGADERVVD